MALAIDASSPAVARSTGATTSTASFTPPANCALVAFFQADADISTSDEAGTVSGGGLSWNLAVRSNGLPAGSAEIWWATSVASPGSITVDCTDNKGSVAKSLAVVVFTGADLVAPIGATQSGTAATQTYSSTRDGSWGWEVGIGSGTPAAASGCTLVDSLTGTFDGGDSIWLTRQTSTTATAGTSVTTGATGVSGMHTVAAEVLPASAAGTAGGPASKLPAHLLLRLAARAQQSPFGDSGVVATNASAEVATATGTAFDATVSIAPSAEATASTGTAFNPGMSGSANAESTTASGAAFDASVSVAPQPTAATGTGSAFDAAVSIGVLAELASSTGTAFDATVSTSSNVNAAAEVASGTGSAASASPAIAVAAEATAATGSAFDATATAAVPAEATNSTGTAFGATVSVGPAPATATGDGAAADGAVAVTVAAGGAAGSGAAFAATVIFVIAISADGRIVTISTSARLTATDAGGRTTSTTGQRVTTTDAEGRIVSTTEGGRL